MRKALIIFLAVVALIIVALSVSVYIASQNHLSSDFAEALGAPEQAVLYAISPDPGDAEGKSEAFHKYKVLGKITLDPAQRKLAAGEFHKAITDWNAMKGIAMCFNPRDGLSVISKGHTYDFVLCYECQQMEIFKDGVENPGLGAYGSPDILNTLFKSAHIPYDTARSGSEAQVPLPPPPPPQ